MSDRTRVDCKKRRCCEDVFHIFWTAGDFPKLAYVTENMKYMTFLPKLSTVFTCSTAGIFSVGTDLQSCSSLQHQRLRCLAKHNVSKCLFAFPASRIDGAWQYHQLSSELAKHQSLFPTNWCYFCVSYLQFHDFSSANELIYSTSHPSVFNLYFFISSFAMQQS